MPTNITDDFLLGKCQWHLLLLSSLLQALQKSGSRFPIGKLGVMPNNGWGGNASISGNLTFGYMNWCTPDDQQSALNHWRKYHLEILQSLPLNGAAGSVLNLNAVTTNLQAQLLSMPLLWEHLIPHLHWL